MVPVLFKIPGLGWAVPGYGFALMIGFLLSIMWAARRAARSGANPDVILNCGFLALLGGVIGSRVMYVVHYWDMYANRGSPLQVALAVLDIRRGGLEVYGGFIFVVALVLGYLWIGRHSIRWYFDIIAPSAALGMSIGRIGCFLNGCCFGGTCDLPWSVQFPYGSPAAVTQWVARESGAGLPAELLLVTNFPDGANATPVPRESFLFSDRELDAARQLRDEAVTDAAAKQKLAKLPPEMSPALDAMIRYGLSAAQLRALAHQHPSLPVHPTQLYSAIMLGLLALMLNALYWRRTRDGQVILTLLLIEPWTRWTMERIRADNPVDVPFFGGLTISQFLAICLSGLGLLGLLALRSLPARCPRAVLWEPPPEPPVAKKKGAAPA